ncbi:microtubule associated protein-like protein [Hyaloscypha variabilis]
MVEAGMGGLDTPRTNVGDATYLSRQLDFDITQEPSFQSPSKDNNNLVQQLQHGRRGPIRTPRSRVALTDRRNLPAGLSGGEFTPLLKSATRNSALRSGKENVPQTPAFGVLDNIPEDFSPLPQGSSVYGDSRNGSYMAGTPMPQIDSSSTTSTPMALLPRRSDGPGVLQDGNQMSLREQENVIDKIEKENFGLKLKIHFLEEAMRKAGPGFSEAALKENTELKVDKVTMQKELYRYRKTLTAAERELELYRQQLLEMQEKVKRKHLDAGQREELDRLHQALEEKEAEVNELKSQESNFEDLQDKIHDLEAELRQKDRLIDDRDDEVENLKDEVEKHTGTILDLEETLKATQRRVIELEERAEAGEQLEDAKETIQELEQSLERLKQEIEKAEEDCQEAMRDKRQAEADLEELQDEMANKSITTKGLSRQIEEKANRLQDELEDLREKHGALEEQHADKTRELKKLQDKIEDLTRDAEVREQKLKDKLEVVQSGQDTSAREHESLSRRFTLLQKELQQNSDEKNLLQIRHDSLTTESAGLQKELSESRKVIEDLEDKLDHEKTLALNNEREVRDEYKGEIDRLNDEIEDLRAELREKDRLYDDDNDKWDNERRNIESQRDLAEEKVVGLQRTIDRLQEAEGSLSSKEMKLQQALQSERERHESQEVALSRQINELNEDLESRQKALDVVRSELAEVKEELRLSQREQKSLSEKVEGLEDEVEILQTSLDDESEQANRELSAAKHESDSLRRQLQASRQDLATAEAAIAGAQAQIKAFQDDLHEGKGSQDQIGARLRDVETQLLKIRLEKQNLQDQLAAVNIEVHSLRTSNTSIEAERDEIASQLKAVKHQEEETFRLDQERMDLRTAKMKLDGEVRRLREENKNFIAQQQAVENELQQEIDRASAEEARLKGEIHDLQKILRGSSEKRELAATKKEILRLQARVQELEIQIANVEGQSDSTNELSMIRRDLTAARQKETEYLQREAAQKDILRGLKRQIMELERKAHDAEISRLVSSSPHSSVSGSARKSELIDVRAQLATAHQTLKDIRSQLKEVENEAARKVNAANLDLQTRTETWEIEKDDLERSLDEAISAKDELASKNAVSEATITRLRGKIDRLEKALQAERLNSGEDRTMALERRDLHEMLRETQLQAESLEIAVQERENTIEAIAAAEAELRAQLKRVRDERSLHRSKATSAHEQLQSLERRYRKAKESWEAEKKNLTRGVRFVNTSLSVNDEAQILALRKEAEEREHHHVKEMRGMTMMIEWLKARCKREEDFRAVAAHGKRYMQLRIDLFEACNKADLELLKSTGIQLDPRPPKKRPNKLRSVVWMVRATVRMKKRAAVWAESRAIHDAIEAQRERQKIQARKSITGGR